MKNNKIALIAAMAIGGLIAYSPVSKAGPNPEPATPAPSATPAAPAPADAPAAPAAPRARAGGDGPIRELLKSLDLNDEQKEKVQEVMKTQREKTMALQKDASLEPKEKMAKRKELRDNMKEEMKKILTPEQYTKFEAGLAKMGPGPGHRPGTVQATSATGAAPSASSAAKD